MLVLLTEFTEILLNEIHHDQYTIYNPVIPSYKWTGKLNGKSDEYVKKFLDSRSSAHPV